jgi:threonine 3-dehydrogenase
MRAILKAQPGPGFTVADVAPPTCGPSDVLIRVRHAGVCGTDLHIYEWDSWAQGRVRPPIIVGHEFSGEIVGVGDEVREPWTVGQRVTAEGHIVRGVSRQSRTGEGHVAPDTEIIGVDRDGAFAEFIAMPSSNIWPLDAEIPDDIGAIHDPMGNAFHTVLTAEVPGSVVLILGCGPIGCFAAGVARAAGAAHVIAVDIVPTRLELAHAMGANTVLDARRGDVVERVQELTGGDGADVVCEMSGVPEVFHQAFACARHGGRVQLLGIPQSPVAIDFASEIIFKGLTVYGVIGRRMYHTWYQMRQFLRSGRFDPRPVMTHQFPLDQIDDAIAVIREGSAGKVILDIGTQT